MTALMLSGSLVRADSVRARAAIAVQLVTVPQVTNGVSRWGSPVVTLRWPGVLGARRVGAGAVRQSRA